MDISETLSKEYSLRFAGIANYRNKVWQVLCNQFFAKFIPANSKVLDLAAGWGEFINNIAAIEKFAMDLNADTKNHLQQNVKLLHQDCSTTWDIADNSLDIIFTSNFFEHLTSKDQLEKVIVEAYRTLKKGGKLICLGPNLRYVFGEYWDFWDHHLPLTERSLSELLQLKDFKIKTCLAKFLPFSMSTGFTPPIIALKIYLMMPFVWRLFGKQFLVIGEK